MVKFAATIEDVDCRLSTNCSPMNKLFFITCFLTFSSCTHELEIIEKPVDLIPQDSMEIVLHEMMLVEAYTRVQHQNVHEFYKVMRRSGNKVLEKYNIDSLRYERSMDYYARKQESLIEIYEKIQDSVSLITAKDSLATTDTVVSK